MSSIFVRMERRNTSWPAWWISCVDSTCDLGQKKHEYEPRLETLCVSLPSLTASVATITSAHSLDNETQKVRSNIGIKSYIVLVNGAIYLVVTACASRVCVCVCVCVCVQCSLPVAYLGSIKGWSCTLSSLPSPSSLHSPPLSPLSLLPPSPPLRSRPPYCG